MAKVDELLKVARSQLGIREGARGWTKYGEAYEVRKKSQGFDSAPWCDMFVAWCAGQVGLLKVVGDFAYTPYHADWFRDNGRWGQTPKKGAIVFFDWAGSRNIGAIDHVGIVEAVRADGSVVTIEGNTSNVVARRVRRSGIAGYGYPRYPAVASGPKPAKPAAGARYPYKSLMRRGWNDSDGVRNVQKRLNALGAKPRLAVDGDFGPRTEAAVRAFQKRSRLEVDGIVGPKTWAKLFS
jgi:hypothetical protein